MDYDNKTTEILNLQTGELSVVNGHRVYDAINTNANCDCYINDVARVAHIYKGGKAGYYSERDGSEDYFTYSYGKCTFRSFTALSAGVPSSKLIDMFPNTTSITSKMYQYISQFGNPCDNAIQYGLAHQVKKMFYRNIAPELWEETKSHKHYYYDIETYNDMYAGAKYGHMDTLIDGTYYAENVIGFDKKSAYPSVLINDNVFPIGKIRNIKYCPSLTVHTIIDHIKEHKWIKIVFDGKINGLRAWYDDKMDKTAMEYYDILQCDLLGGWSHFTDAINSNDYRLYDCQETGYLSKTFRNEIIKLYNEKETNPKNSTARFLAKTMIDMLVGKGIQKKYFNDRNDVIKYYKGRGENYLTPEFALHCIARVRYELVKAQIETGGIYEDTDGIKVYKTQENIEYFEELNRKILERNRLAGFETNIGIWDIEINADRFICFGKKFYTYDDNGTIINKWAGVVEEMKSISIDLLPDGDIIDNMRKHGITYFQPFYKFVDGAFVKYIKQGADGLPQKCHMKGDLEHE